VVALPLLSPRTAAAAKQTSLKPRAGYDEYWLRAFARRLAMLTVVMQISGKRHVIHKHCDGLF
jgi:hypothetical protein